MSDSVSSRRTFVAAVGALGATWMLRDVAAVDQALAYAATAVSQQPTPRFATLTADEALQLRAMAEAIIPSDDGPGAREAGVIYFMDRALGTFAADSLPAIRKGLADVAVRARKVRRSVTSFESLSPAERNGVLHQIEKGAFFAQVRYLTIVGMFAHPLYGGNRNQVGWKLLGFEPAMTHTYPFGYYDAEAARGR